MFERFTDRARKVLAEAQAEAIETGVGFIGTEHLLIGMLRVESGVSAVALEDHRVRLDQVREKVGVELAQYLPAKPVDDATALAAIGIDIDAVRAAVEAAFGQGSLPDPAKQPPFTPLAKSVLENSLNVSLRWRHRYIGTEHLLAGLVTLGEGLAISVLKDLGVDLEALKDTAKRLAAPEIRRADMAWQESIDLTRRVWELPPGTRRDELMGRWQEAFEAISEEQQTVTAAATQLAERVETLTQSITQALADSA